MLYYNINNLGDYTNNEKLAKLKVKYGEWEDYGFTDEEIIIQDDNFEYVLKTNFIKNI